jgi:hypothetical protein
MTEPVCIGCSFQDDRIVPDLPLDRIAALVSEGSTVAVLKRVLPLEDLENMRNAVSEWGRRTPLTAPQTYLNENFHAIERGISPRQKTLHLYHAYNFNRLLQLPAGMSKTLLQVYEPLRELYCRLTSRELGWGEVQEGARLRPQVIQYPAGGGHFATHQHPLTPQRIGFILSLSQRGTNYETGSVGFEALNGQTIDSADWHDFGDMILFRFDLRHWVTAVDIEKPLDLSSANGRWVVTLPLN